MVGKVVKQTVIEKGEEVVEDLVGKVVKQVRNVG